MSEPAGKPRLSEIYREQYREVSASKTSRAFRWITPVGLLVVAALGVILGRGAHDILSIILGGGALVIFAVLIVIMRRQRSRG
jgi:tellurite resistance protein TehA-like permease